MIMFLGKYMGQHNYLKLEKGIDVSLAMSYICQSAMYNLKCTNVPNVANVPMYLIPTD